MPYIPLEKLLDKTDNSMYKLVILASLRAQEITQGNPLLIEVDHSLKASTIALEEIAQGKIRYKKKKRQD